MIHDTRHMTEGKQSIRVAQLADAAVLAEHNVLLAKETEDLTLDPATTAKGVEAVLNDPSKGVYYVAEVDGAVVGQLLLTYEWSDWRNGSFWWIQSVYVKQEFRGRGLFRTLFEHLRELAGRRQDVRALRLYVHSENERARRSYERLGMKRSHYEVFDLEVG